MADLAKYPDLSLFVFLHSSKEHLDRTIQASTGSSGHSSIEDSIATLDLVKWFVLNKKTKPYSLAGVPPDPRGGASGSSSALPSGTGAGAGAGTGSGGRSMGAVGPVAAANGLGMGTAAAGRGISTGRGHVGDGEQKKREPLFDDTWG